MNKFQIGDKVVPVNLSVYESWDLSQWLDCNFSIQHFFKENGYLFVKEISPNGRIICSEKLEPGGFNDPFKPSDLIPYVEPSKFNVGDKVITSTTRYSFNPGKQGVIVNIDPDGTGVWVEFPDEIKSPSAKWNELYPNKQNKGCWIMNESLEPYVEPKAKPQLKIGDRVKVVADTFPWRSGDLIGKTGTICNKPFSAKDIYGINFDEDILGHDCKGTCERGHGFNLPAADLELLKPSFGCKPINHAPENETALKFMGRLTPDGPRIKERYIFNGPATICIITYDGKQFKGVAKCNPKDAWSTAAGQTIAMERASIELSKYRIAQAANR